MPGTDDRNDELLREAFATGLPEPEYEADSAQPEAPPAPLRARIIARAAQRTAELLTERLREGAEEIGWSLDDLAEEAGDEADQARALLRYGGDPRRLSSDALARLFWRVELEPADWSDLLLQAVVAHAVFPRPAQGEIWGRTTGLTGPSRADALLGAAGERDPEKARRVARIFVDGVIEEWKSLRKSKSTLNPQNE